VRELSQKFDNWSPTSFKLAPSEVERAIGQVPKRDLDDIRFAQAQVRNFAKKQRATLRDLEVETPPGIVLGHRHIPVDSIGCYVPGGRYPMVASAHMSIVTARVAGVRHIIACAPPFKAAWSYASTRTLRPTPASARARPTRRRARGRARPRGGEVGSRSGRDSPG
jgi:sulfopropanediol 3-dehydrogenase